MPDHQDPDFLEQQQAMFTRIARRYDLMNNLMSGWRDNTWRRYTAKKVALPESGLLLDLGAGTGKLALEAEKQYIPSQIVAADLTLPMMELGRDRNPQANLDWLAVDGYNLPFPTGSFDGVISGFLARNLSDPFKGLTEQYRVLKRGGKIVVLDTTKRQIDFLTPVIRFYMYKLIPFLSGTITGTKEAYTYLYESTERFLRAEELTAYLAAVGFKKVVYKLFMFGIVAIHWGEK